jgi:hypothetical protein
MGLEPIGRPVLRGNRYVLRAIDGRGVEVKIFADAVSGRVLFAEPLGYGREPVYAERSYPPGYYPEGRTVSPQRSGEPQGNYDPRRNYQQQGNYDQQESYQRQAPQNPGEPPVIYAPRDSANAQNPSPQPAIRPPSVAKPPAPKVAAKPPAQPAPASAPEEAPKTEPQRDATNTTGTAASPPAAVEKNPALIAPPVQAFD